MSKKLFIICGVRWQKTFEGEGGLLGISHSYKKFGLNLQSNGDITYKEWAPSAKALSIVRKIRIISS